jgi:hypothetical protein
VGFEQFDHVDHRKSTSVSEQRVTSIVRAKEAKEETSMKQAVSMAIKMSIDFQWTT